MSLPKDTEIGTLVDHLFRNQYGKMVAVLTSIFGLEHLGMAEDMVQDTLLEAFQRWSYGKVPPNPEAWLMLVAKNKALNALKREKVKQKVYQAQQYESHRPDDLDHFFGAAEIEDSQLRMMFACCHPAISKEDQIAMVLKTLCGFGNKEIARALLLGEEAINKRLYRAKQTFKKQQLQLTVPTGADLNKRLDAVCTGLYLLFNEGYNSHQGETLIRKDLCLEAMRLCQLLLVHFPDKTKLPALLALMCFHVARFDSRIDNKGALIIFADQDRSFWNTSLIQSGMYYLAEASKGDTFSAYHLEASIAAQHCHATSLETTNWKFIQTLYQKLYELKPSPVILLNLAIVAGQVNGPKEALKQLQLLLSERKLANYHLLHATLGEVHLQLGNHSKALAAFQQAMQCHPSAKEQAFLKEKITRLDQSS